MASELYACFVNSDVNSVYGENFASLEGKQILTKGEIYEVLYVDRSSSATGVYLNISGMRGMELNSQAFEFFTKDPETGVLVEHDIYTDPVYANKSDSDFYREM